MNNKILKLEVFSRLRNLTEIVKKEEEMLEDTIKMQDLPSYAFGLDRGLEEGREEGIQIGVENRNIEIAKNLLSLNLEIERIMQATGLTREEIERLMSDKSR